MLMAHGSLSVDGKRREGWLRRWRIQASGAERRGRSITPPRRRSSRNVARSASRMRQAARSSGSLHASAPERSQRRTVRGVTRSRLATSVTVKSGTGLPPWSGPAASAGDRRTPTRIDGTRGTSRRPTRSLGDEGRPARWHTRHLRLEAAGMSIAHAPSQVTSRLSCRYPPCCRDVQEHRGRG